MDEHFIGKAQLLKGQPESIKAKYQTLREMHEKWDVEAFTMVTAMKQNFYIGMLLPFFWMKNVEHTKQLQQTDPSLK